jgi:hypothetical protein
LVRQAQWVQAVHQILLDLLFPFLLMIQVGHPDPLFPSHLCLHDHHFHP